jgi:hypothetical protein
LPRSARCGPGVLVNGGVQGIPKLRLQHRGPKRGVLASVAAFRTFRAFGVFEIAQKRTLGQRSGSGRLIIIQKRGTWVQPRIKPVFESPLSISIALSIPFFIFISLQNLAISFIMISLGEGHSLKTDR